MAANHTIFIDDSRAEKPPANVLGALIVPSPSLLAAEERWSAFRTWLLDTYGLPVEKELNASKLIRGAYKEYGIYRIQGSAAYKYALRALAEVDGLGVICCAWTGSMNFQGRAFQFLGERLEANMYRNRSNAHVICDEGQNMLGMFRRLKEKNEIKALGHMAGGTFADGSRTKNIPWNHLLSFEHVDSKTTWGVQAADFIAFACLRTEHPTESLSKHGLGAPWKLLEPLWIREASPSRDGVIRKPR